MSEKQNFDKVYETVRALPGATLAERAMYAFYVVIGLALVAGVQPQKLTIALEASLQGIKKELS